MWEVEVWFYVCVGATLSDGVLGERVRVMHQRPSYVPPPEQYALRTMPEYGETVKWSTSVLQNTRFPLHSKNTCFSFGIRVGAAYAAGWDGVACVEGVWLKAQENTLLYA